MYDNISIVLLKILVNAQTSYFQWDFRKNSMEAAEKAWFLVSDFSEDKRADDLKWKI